MKKRLLFSLLIISLSINAQSWKTDLDEVMNDTTIDSSQLILLNFSGLDWCKPCKKLHHGLFSDTAFVHYSDTALILVNVDFPTNQKSLSKETIQKKEKWAEKYNPTGIFPYTILMTKNGHICSKWSGLINMSVHEFIDELIKNKTVTP